MNTPTQQMLAKFAHKHELSYFERLMRMLRKENKPARCTTHKPAFSMGFRGDPRTMRRTGAIPAPTIDQVRKLEKKYLCKLVVKQGLIYFRDGTAFTNERGRAHKIAVIDDMATQCNATGG